MKNKITVLSRQAAEELISSGFPEGTAVISFYDPITKRTPEGYGPPDYEGVCGRVFTVALHDIDIDSLEDYGLTIDSYFPEADDAAGFITDAVNNGLDIICQCEYGQSRSSACAAAIREFFDGSGIEYFADYRYYPNQLVFNKLLDALRAYAGKNAMING